jgi:hypothetical protein
MLAERKLDMKLGTGGLYSAVLSESRIIWLNMFVSLLKLELA